MDRYMSTIPFDNLPSPLETFPVEVLGNIALHLTEHTFLGPPSDVLDLLLASRTIRDKVDTSHFWAGVFRQKFDVAAILRRAPSCCTASNLAAECVKRFQVLRRIKSMEIYPNSNEDLWTAYLMMLENDGKNEDQLLQWAMMPIYVKKMLLERWNAPSDSPLSWYGNMEGTALTLSLYWMSYGRSETARNSSGIHKIINDYFLHPLLVAGFCYPSTHGFEAFFQPPESEEDCPASRAGGPVHDTASVLHYDCRLRLSPPLLTSAAQLAFKVHHIPVSPQEEAYQALHAGLPANRAIANQTGRDGPTQEDLVEYYKICCTDVSATSRCLGSIRYDPEWYRLVLCHDIHPASAPLKSGPVYVPGSLTGSWGGQFMAPEQARYLELLQRPPTRFHTEIVPVNFSIQPFFLELKEHFCLPPNQPFASGSDTFGGDNLLNAWFPSDFTHYVDDDTIGLYSRSRRQKTRYTTHMQRVQAHDVNAVDPPLQTELSTRAASYSWDDDDTVDPALACIRDIVITGETSDRHGEAWARFKVVGRVRRWDGMIVLIRTMVDPPPGERGPKWIFKGYVHDRRLVGRWRETATGLLDTGFEGPFFLQRTDVQ